MKTEAYEEILQRLPHEMRESPQVDEIKQWLEGKRRDASHIKYIALAAMLAVILAMILTQFQHIDFIGIIAIFFGIFLYMFRRQRTLTIPQELIEAHVKKSQSEEK